MAKSKLDYREIRGEVGQAFDNAESALTLTRDEQAEAVKKYFVRDKNEDRRNAGFSQVQVPVVRDTIESMLPILMDMYLQPERPVVFKPADAEDMAQAKQETGYVNHNIFTKNNGNLIFYTWFKDALWLKNGYIKCFWDEKVASEQESYEGINEVQLAELSRGENVEFKEVEEILDADTGEVRYNVTIERTEDESQVRIINIPSERVYVDPAHTSIDLEDCNYSCHYEERTKESLITDGYDAKVVDSLPYSSDVQNENVGQERSQDGSTSDRESKLVLVYEHYVRADYDGKGVSLWQVVTGGSADGEVLSCEKVDKNPIIALTPFIVPHRHIGQSLADMVMESQDLQTAIMRQTVDNLNLVNNQQKYVDINKLTDLKQVANQRLGGIITGKGAGAVEPVVTPFVAAANINVLEYVQTQQERSTGLSRQSMGLDAEALAGATNLVGAMSLNQTQLRMKMIASMFAETGVKSLVLRVRELCMKNSQKEDMADIDGEFVAVNPSSWRNRRDTQVRIGVGTVQKQERLGALQQIIQMQEKVVAAQGGAEGALLTYENIYNALSEIESLAGHMGNDRYFSNPEKYQAPPPKEDPMSEALEIETAKVAVKAQKEAADIEIERERLKLEAYKLRLQEQELNLKAAEAGVKLGKELISA